MPRSLLGRTGGCGRVFDATAGLRADSAPATQPCQPKIDEALSASAFFDPHGCRRRTFPSFLSILSESCILPNEVNTPFDHPEIMKAPQSLDVTPSHWR